MSKIAVIATGGKQYKVKEGDVISVEKLEGKEGKKVTFDTLLVADEKGKDVEVGTPKVKGKVEGKIVAQLRDKKLVIRKFKAKSRYRKTIGHRQDITKVEIVKI